MSNMTLCSLISWAICVGHPQAVHLKYEHSCRVGDFVKQILCWMLSESKPYICVLTVTLYTNGNLHILN